MKDKLKKNYNNIDYRFSVLLTLTDLSSENKNDIIIFKRDFNIHNVDEESLYSLNLKEVIDELVVVIDRDLKSKSRVYLWYFYNKDHIDAEFIEPIPKEDVVTFKLSFLDGDKTVISKIWSGDYYPLSIRNDVDLTNKKYRNLSRYEYDFTKKVMQKASVDKLDITSLIMRHLSSVCGCHTNNRNDKIIYKQHLTDVEIEETTLDKKTPSGFGKLRNKIDPVQLIEDDNGYKKTIYKNYVTTMSFGDKIYNLNV